MTHDADPMGQQDDLVKNILITGGIKIGEKVYSDD